MRIRPAVLADAPLVLDLIQQLATYERARESVVATVEDLVRDGFGEHPRFHVLLGEEGESALAFALYFFTYSTWEGRQVLYLEDLFVLPAARKRGIGAALMRHLAATAVDTGCTRFQWQVLDWNTDAVAFYERLGARVLPGWNAVRVEGDALIRLASGSAS
jgi:GNAT superfamily N-acetyltransferase